MQVSTVVELTTKEELFVICLGYGNPPTVAAKNSGYAIGSASRLMAKPHIQAALLAVHHNTGQILEKLRKRQSTMANAVAAMDGEPVSSANEN